MPKESRPTRSLRSCWRRFRSRWPRRRPAYESRNKNMARILKPPTPLTLDPSVPSVFLAGSIEMGLAEDWQSKVAESLREMDIVVLNPRRDVWDPTWSQSINNPLLREQVEWELQGLDAASVVAMYFAPETKAPVTLLELGLVARSGKLLVCCPNGFWRKGNVEIVCNRFGVPLVGNLAALTDLITMRLGIDKVIFNG